MISTTVPLTVGDDTAPAGRTSRSRWGMGREWWTSGRLVVLCAALLVLVQVLSRIWIVDQRWLFGDDIALVSQALDYDMLSSKFLVDQRGGHFAPAALLLTGLLAHLDPLAWWPMATASVVLAAIASLAVWRMLRLFLGDRPAILVPLSLYLFSTVNLGGFTWWSAAMQTLPLQIGIAWMVADAVLYVRTRRTRYAVTAPLALAVTLLFTERAVTIPFLAFGVVALLLHVEGVLTPLREVWRRSRPLWSSVLLVLVAWILAFRAAVPSGAYDSVTISQLLDTVRYFLSNLVPGLAGGPWEWQGFRGSTPIAATPSFLFHVSDILLIFLVAWTCWRRRGAPLLWLLAIAFAAGNAVLLGLGRGEFGFADFLPLAYRYYPAEPVLLAIVIGLLFALPVRRPERAGSRIRIALLDLRAAVEHRVESHTGARWAGRLIVSLLTLFVLAGSAVSTIRHVDAWSEDPAKDYFTTARAELAAAGDSPLLDQAVPEEIMWSLGAPFNSTGTLFRPFRDRPEFGDVTDDLRQFDATGKLQQARITELRSISPGPLENCGWGIRPGETTDVALSGPFVNWSWTAQLNYLAGDDGAITVTMGEGPTVRVPVEKGPNTVYLRLPGGGDHLTVSSATDDLGVCIDSGSIGMLEVPGS